MLWTLWTELAEAMKTVRVTVDLNEVDYQRLSRLANSKTKAKVIRNALRLFGYLARRHAEGFSLQHIKDGETSEVPLSLLM